MIPRTIRRIPEIRGELDGLIDGRNLGERKNGVLATCPDLTLASKILGVSFLHTKIAQCTRNIRSSGCHDILCTDTDGNVMHTKRCLIDDQFTSSSIICECITVAIKWHTINAHLLHQIVMRSGQQRICIIKHLQPNLGVKCRCTNNTRTSQTLDAIAAVDVRCNIDTTNVARLLILTDLGQDLNTQIARLAIGIPCIVLGHIHQPGILVIHDIIIDHTIIGIGSRQSLHCFGAIFIT